MRFSPAVERKCLHRAKDLTRPGSTDAFGSLPGLGLVQTIATERCVEHFGPSRAIPSSQNRKLFVVALILHSLHSRNPETKSHQLDSLKDFHSCSLSEIFRYYILQTLCAAPLKAKII
jgi:hypothetical protein